MQFHGHSCQKHSEQPGNPRQPGQMGATPLDNLCNHVQCHGDDYHKQGEQTAQSLAAVGNTLGDSEQPDQ